MTKWENIVGLLVVCGSVRFKLSQYKVVRRLLKMFLGTDGVKFPSYSKARRNIVKNLFENCYPASYLREYTVDSRHLLP